MTTSLRRDEADSAGALFPPLDWQILDSCRLVARDKVAVRTASRPPGGKLLFVFISDDRSRVSDTSGVSVATSSPWLKPFLAGQCRDGLISASSVASATRSFARAAPDALHTLRANYHHDECGQDFACRRRLPITVGDSVSIANGHSQRRRASVPTSDEAETVRPALWQCSLLAVRHIEAINVG